MSKTKEMANRFREVMLNGLWIANTNYKDQLSTITLEQATTKIGILNTIALLTFHINYYIEGVAKVLKGGPLDIKDQYSFDAPTLTSEEDWQTLLTRLWNNSETFADLLERMPDEKLEEVFVDKKYGDYQRNMDAIIEHSYYHLGQIVLIKKLVLQD